MLSPVRICFCYCFLFCYQAKFGDVPNRYGRFLKKSQTTSKFAKQPQTEDLWIRNIFHPDYLSSATRCLIFLNPVTRVSTTGFVNPKYFPTRGPANLKSSQSEGSWFLSANLKYCRRVFVLTQSIYRLEVFGLCPNMLHLRQLSILDPTVDGAKVIPLSNVAQHLLILLWIWSSEQLDICATKDPWGSERRGNGVS